MIKKTLLSICVIAIGLCIGVAQSNNPPISKSESLNLQGIRLSIIANTNVVSIGASVMVTAKIDNSSTNEISVGESSFNNRDFKVILRDKFGKKYDLTPELTPAEELSSRMILRRIMPGESYSWNITVEISKDIKPGEYSLQVKKNITKEWHNVNLTSNSIKVTIVAAS